MCFSATASFTAAAVIGTVGVATLWSAANKHDRRILPLAVVPILFASQQLVEGLLWLDLAEPNPGVLEPILVNAFQGYAQLLWPTLTPLGLFLVEPDSRRRRLLLLCLFVGAAVAVYLLTQLIAYPWSAVIGNGHIVYENGRPHPFVLAAIYLLATVVSLTFSSHKALQLISVVFLAGFVASDIYYFEARLSVWCFFGAIASMLVYLFVRHTYQPNALSRA